MKAQRPPLDYKIMKDDGEMISIMVQECLANDFDHVAHHRDKLQKELIVMEQLINKFREA
jgi:hypothetical protein